ncbi:MAG: hypothetical protein RL348_52 [Bacteroidota bacterium]|jgi:hypothetical protein
MAITRGTGKTYNVGEKPPTVVWTFVKGDTSAFRVYVTDDAKQPLNIPDWTISLKIKRPTDPEDAGVITDNATTIMALTPAADADDADGEFTVSLTAEESVSLQTGDIFDIQLSSAGNTQVWTVAQGSLVVLEDVTD